MISSESRMRENRTSGLMSGGLETRSREPDCGPERKRWNDHRTLKLARQPPTLPEVRGRRDRRERFPRAPSCRRLAQRQREDGLAVYGLGDRGRLGGYAEGSE